LNEHAQHDVSGTKAFSPFPPSPEPGAFAKNIPFLNAFAFLKMALLPMAIITLFWKDQIGLSLTEILFLQAIFSLATVIMEFPSGYLSDRIGYRKALFLASLLGISGWTSYTLATSFTGVLVAEIQLGMSYAFVSGADSALLYETLRQDGREEEYAAYDGRMTAWAQVGEASGAIGAGVFYAWFPLLPFLLQIGIWLTALVVCYQLKETPSEPFEATHSHLRHAIEIARKAFWGHPGLRWSIILAAFLGLASFYPVWLIQPYMQEHGVPLAWFGPVWAVANLSVSLGSVTSYRLQFHLGPAGILCLCAVLIIAGYAGLGLTGTLWGFAFYFLLTFMRGIQGPFLRLVLQKQSARPERASILSLKSLAFRLAFVITGPLVGALADNLGLQTAMIIMLGCFGTLLLPVMLVFHKRTVPVWQ
jgi:MFS family permease